MLIGLVVVIVLLAAAGWGYSRWNTQRKAEKALNQLTQILTNASGGQVKVDVDADGQSVDISVNGGSLQVGTNAKVPDDFPNDIPIYPGSTVASSFSATQLGTTTGQSVTLTTSDAVATVAAYYKQQMVQQGWTSVSTFDIAGVSQLSYSKGTRTASVSVATQDNLTAVMLYAYEQ